MTKQRKKRINAAGSVTGQVSVLLLIAPVVALVALGLVMLGSTGGFSAESGSDLYFNVKRQILWLSVGGCACCGLTMIDYHLFEKFRVPLFVLSVVLLAACFVPFIGERVNGASRWISGKAIGLDFLRFQPSELGKLCAIVFLAAWYHRRDKDEAAEFGEGFFRPLLLIGLLVLLIGAEVDLGSAALVVAVSVAVMFVAGVGMKYLSVMAGAGLAGLALMIYLIPNRTARLVAFLDLEAHKTDIGMQQWRALLALGSGGLEGLGLGLGRQKMAYLPFAHTDFIFPIIGEELGIYYTLGVVLCFALILAAGYVIALYAPDRFGRLLAFGLTTAIVLQAALNIAVTTGTLPNKGLPLPFVSYGGSNLLFCLASLGIILNIYRQGTNLSASSTPRISKSKVTPRL